MSFNGDIADLVRESENGLLSCAPWWRRVPLAQIVDVTNGFPFASEFFSDAKGERLIRIRDVTTGDTATFFRGPVPDGYWVEPGDIVVGMDGDFNLRVWSAARGLLNQRVCKLTPNDEVLDRSFLALIMPGYLKLINEHTSSVTVKHLSSRTIQQIPLPLPPLAEQRRIVARIEALFARTRRARADLERIAPLTSHLRRRKVAEAFLNGLEDGWPVSALETVTSEARIGLVRSKSEQFETGCHPYVRMQHFDYLGRWFIDNATFVEASAFEIRQYTLLPGDLLFNTRNSVELVGKAAVWPKGLPRHLYNNNLLRIRFTADMEPDFVKWALLAPPAADALMRAKSATTSVAAIYQRDIMQVPIPTPPRDTQRKVAEAISRAVISTYELDHQASRSLLLLDNLEQSILSRAFLGELVPQDPNDEPVSVAVARLRGQTSAPTASRRGRPRSAA